jgi:hypothetical protein
MGGCLYDDAMRWGFFACDELMGWVAFGGLLCYGFGDGRGMMGLRLLGWDVDG